MRNKFFLLLLFISNAFILAEDYSEKNFEKLYSAISKKTAFAPVSHISPESLEIVKRLYGMDSEVSAFSASISDISFNFEDDKKNQFELTVTNNQLQDSLMTLRDLVSEDVVKGVPRLQYRHSKSSPHLPKTGVVFEQERDQQRRFLFIGEDDTSLVYFWPAQADLNNYGFMLCPRLISGHASSAVGKFLKPSQYKLTKLRANFKASIFARLIDGFGPGKIESNYILFGNNFKPIKTFSDVLSGVYPQISLVPNPSELSQEIDFNEAEINSIGIENKLILTDSGNNVRSVSYKNGYQVKYFNLTDSQPMISEKKLYSVRPGNCYSILSTIWFDQSFQAGEKLDRLPKIN